jgi:large subunit ribosomal protein L5
VKARLRERYETEIVGELKKKFEYRNIMQVPRIEKVVINIGVGEATQEPRMLEMAMAELTMIAGQKPTVRHAKKSISNFKLREGQKIGCTVTLRGDRMYEFMDRLFNMAMPRIRDFRGVPRKSFDKDGNYTLGLRDQTIFPDLKADSVEKSRGMNITFVMKNPASREASFDLLTQLGMPFQRQN